MTLEQAIEAQIARYGLPRGLTATPGHRYYNQAESVDFRPCECSRGDRSFRGPGDDEYFDYVGQAGETPVYVSAFNKTTVGPKGYHFKRNEECRSLR